MSSKKTTTQTSNSKSTNAPPSWTLPGIEALAGQVMPAFEASKAVPKYTGPFTAIPDQRMTEQLQRDYMNTHGLSGKASMTLDGWADAAAKAKPAFGDATTFGAGDYVPGAAPTLSTMDQLLKLQPTVADLQGSQNILEGPDFAAMMPTWQDWNPNAFQADDGGARLEAAMTAAQQPVFRQLMEQVLPSIQSSAIEAGAYSGDRAMSVVPGQAISEAAGRANEITQGLAYEGFQQEEGRRLQAWQAFEQMLAENALAENDFNSGNFATRAGAEANVFGTRQGAATSQSNAIINALTSMYGTNADAMLGMDRNAIDLWQSGEANKLAAGSLSNQAYGLETERGLGTFDAGVKGRAAASALLMDSLMTSAAQADMTQGRINAGMSRDQAVIDDALARDSYETQYPFRGMDIASQLLASLSGNYGTSTSEGSSKTVEKTGGLGSVVQGIAGLGMMGASLFGGGGPLGGLLGSAAGAAPAANIFKFNKNGLAGQLG